MTKPPKEKPLRPNLKRHRLIAFSICVSALAVLTLDSLAGHPARSASCSNPVTAGPETLGVIDSNGRWVIRPIYEQIVYVKSIDSYWALKRKSQPKKDSSILSHFFDPNRNESWTLIDRNGTELKSRFPEGIDPVVESPPSQAVGVSYCSDAIAVTGESGSGFCDPSGNAITQCIYDKTIDVGDGIWMLQERYQKPLLVRISEFFNPPGLGGDAPSPPPFEFFDHSGRKIATLPQCISMPRGRFVNGLLACDCADGTAVALDRTGRIVIPAGEKIPQYCNGATALKPQCFDCIYEIPTSTKSPVRFLQSCDTCSMDYRAPIPVTSNMAIVMLRQGSKLYSGLVGADGHWIMAPHHERLAYCAIDRFIASSN